MTAAAPDRGGEPDVIVLGGALAGAATALLLRRAQPGLRIVVLEKSVRFGRRVGEATVEVSGYFLTRVLGLAAHLNDAHLTKQGMRFWFANSGTRTLADCSEVGGRYLARVPAWQVDRAVLDEEVLARAAAAGVQVWRPAKALSVQPTPGGRQAVTVEHAGVRRTLEARWVVDATGFAALLSRQLGWYRRNPAHPTTAVWTRWRGVRDLDGLELRERYPDWAAACHGLRSTATNHLMGDGWWAWCIPLKGGDYSIGAVFDQRLVKFPDGPGVAARLRTFLEAHPFGRELLAGAEPVEGDSHWRSHLPYFSTQYATDGLVLVGDAGAFLDPFYSPGMDWLSYTVCRAVDLIAAERRGEPLAPVLAAHNADLAQSYERWFEAIYRDKYWVMGDFELMSLLFRLDLGLYYLGVVSQPVRFGPAALRRPVFTGRRAVWPYRLMAHYARRLARMAAERRKRGVFGRHNTGRRRLLNGFRPDPSTVPAVLGALVTYGLLELREGWRTWFRPLPVPAASAAGGIRTAEPAG